MDEENSSSEQELLGFLSRHKMMKLEEESDEFITIEKSFLSGMGPVSINTRLVSIHKNSFSSIDGEFRFQAFCIWSDAMAEKRGGSPNIKLAWYGGSRKEICSIIYYAFTGFLGPPYNGSRVLLSPEKFSIAATLQSSPDENGVRHVLLCKVILGNMEVVSPDSDPSQSHSSSMNFDSGVDNLSEPQRYIIWRTGMHKYILPTYLISFRISPTLSATAGKHHAILNDLSPYWMELIHKYLNDYREKKLSRDQLVQRVSQVVRDNDGLEKQLVGALVSLTIHEANDKSGGDIFYPYEEVLLV